MFPKNTWIIDIPMKGWGQMGNCPPPLEPLSPWSMTSIMLQNIYNGIIRYNG